MFDIKQTLHLAELSKLKFTDDELLKITKNMEDIISLMDKVCDFDEQDNLEDKRLNLAKNIRADEVKDSMPRDEALANASEREGTFFTVPKVV
jgi:aspartyl-tRNA(Asn)/glutamyl-tRNA(Gln) amidotransferase subunit C